MNGTRWPGARLRQAGLSLVELMVGLAVGMIVVAGAALLAASQISDNRRLVAEMQVLQDLRATADIVTREVRRAGALMAPESVVWTPDHPGTDPGGNDDVIVGTVNGEREISFKYERAGTTIGQLGFKTSAGKIQTRMPAMSNPADPTTAYQDLTDSRTMTVNSLTITPRLVSEPTAPAPVGVPCPKLCTGGGTACWPKVRMREYTIVITGTSTIDPTVKRTLSTTVRARADQLVFSPSVSICPSY